MLLAYFHLVMPPLVLPAIYVNEGKPQKREDISHEWDTTQEQINLHYMFLMIKN